MSSGAIKFCRRVLLNTLLVCGLYSLILASSTSVNAAAGINQQINFQGRLLNAQGATVPDGFYNIEFKIYQDGDGLTAGDTTGTPTGVLKWTEDHLNSASHGVTVKNGFLSVQLGSVTAFGGSIDWNQDTLWLSMNVAGTASCTPFSTCSPDGEMIPMKRLSANAYSLNSSLLNGLASSQFIQLAQGVQTDTSTASSLFINKTGGSGNLLQLQSGSSDKFVVDFTGAVTAPSVTGATTLTLQSNTTSAITLDSGTTGAVNVGTGANTKTISLGAVGSTVAADTIQVATSTGAAQSIYIGGTGTAASTSNASSTIAIQGGATAFKTATNGVNVVTYTNSTSAFQVLNSSSVAVLSVDTTNNYVGVGTAAPAAPLHVVKTSAGALTVPLKLENSSSAGSTAVGIAFAPDATGTVMGQISSVDTLAGFTTADLVFSTYHGSLGYLTEKLRIRADGNVGIDTSTIGTNNRLIVNAYSTVDNLATAQINTNAATNKGLVIQGITSQSANLFEVQDSTGAILSSVGSTGAVLLKNSANSSAAFQVQTSSGTPIFTVDTSTGKTTLGSTGTNTGAIAFKGSTAASGTLTLSGPNNPNTFTLSIPAITNNANVCTDNAVCSGYAPSATNGYVAIAPSSVQGDTTTNASIFLNKSAGSGNLLELQSGSSDKFVVGFTGNITAGTYNSDTLSSTALTFTGANPVISASTLNTSLSLQANGTGTLTLNTSGAGTVNLGTANTTTIGIGNGSSTNTITGSTNNINGNTNINTSNTASTAIGNGTGNFSVVSPGLNVTTAGSLSGVTGYTQASGNFGISGSGTFSTGTGAISLNGTTTVAANQNLVLTSGSGNITQAYSNTAAGSAQSLSIGNNNSGAAVTIQGINLTPTNIATPSSGTNVVNVVNFAAGTNSGTTNGINFASATGYTNFINSPTAILSSAGAFSGLTGYAQSTGDLAYSGGGNFSIASSGLSVTTGGALSGITGYTQGSGNFGISGTGTFGTGTGAVSLNGATTVSSTLTVQGANALTLGTTGTNTGAVLFKGTTAASGTLTLAGPSNPNTFTLSLPAITANANICTDNVVCSGYAPSTGGGYVAIGPSAVQGDTTTNSTIFINKSAGSGNLLELQSGSADKFLVGFTGNVTAGTYNGDTLSSTALTFTGATPVISASTTNTSLTLQANGTGTLTLNTTGSGTINLGATSTTLGIGNAGSTNTLTGTTNNILGNTNINVGNTASTAIGNGTGSFSVISSGLNVTTAGAISGSTGYIQGSGNFSISGSGTFGTGTGAISLNGATTIAANQNLTLTSGTGLYSQAYSNNVAGSAHSISIANSNSGAGVAIQGIDLTPNNTATASSGTNNLNVINLGAGGALGGTDRTNGINFASATGYTNFINSPSFVLSSAGAISGSTGYTQASGNFALSGGGNFGVTNLASTFTGLSAGNSVATSITTGAASNIGLVVQGAASQTADLLNLQDSTGANINTYDNIGNSEQLGYLNTPFGGIGNYANLLLQSEAFNNASWVKTTVTAPSANTIVSPDGSTSAEVLSDTGSGGSVSETTSTAATNANYTFSVWLRTSSGTQAVDLRIDGGTTGTGTKATVTVTTTWQRFSVTQNPNGFTGNIKVVIFPGGTAGTGAVDAWGAQLVLGSTPQVYVNTNSSVVAATSGLVDNGSAIFQGTNSTTAFQIQNSSSYNVLVVDTTGNQLKILDGTATQAYLSLSYNDGTTTGTLSVSGGTTAVGSGTGPINITAGSGAAIAVTANATSTWKTTAGTLTLQSGTSSDLILTSGSSAVTISGSSVLKLGQGTSDPTCSVGAIDYNTTSGTLRGCQGASPSWFDLVNVTAFSLQQNYTASIGGTTPEILLDSTRGGLDIQDANTSIAADLLDVRASAVGTLGTVLFGVGSTGTTTLSSAAGLTLLTADAATNSVQIGLSAIHSTGPVTFGLDAYQSATAGTEPTAVDGAMYYDADAGVFRCAINTFWQSCDINNVESSYVFEDEFLGGTTSAATGTSFQGVGALGWNVNATTSCAAAYNQTGPALAHDHPGTLRLTTGAANGNGCAMTQAGTAAGTATLSEIVGVGDVFKTNIAISAQTGTTRVGWTNQTSNTAPTSGAWWEYANASDTTHLRYCYANNTTAVCAAGPVIAANTWAELEIHINATNNITFIANIGATPYTFTTASTFDPGTTNKLGPTDTCYASTTTALSCYVDYIQWSGYNTSGNNIRS